MSEIENGPDAEPSLSSPLAIVFVPFVLAADGAKALGRRFRAVAKWLRRRLTPLAIWLRELGQKLWDLAARILKPLMIPLTTVANLLDRAYDRIARTTKPALDALYAGPMAMGRAWGRIRSSIAHAVRGFYRRLAATRLWIRSAQLIGAASAALRSRTRAARETMARITAAVRNRLNGP